MSCRHWHSELVAFILRARFFLAAAILLAATVAGRAAQAQFLAPLGPLDADGRVTYFIAELPSDPAIRPGDRELAVWALESWERASRGALTFVPAESEEGALVRVEADGYGMTLNANNSVASQIKLRSVFLVEQ